jgi:hypothetical protein
LRGSAGDVEVLELQPVGHARIEEHLDGVERHQEPLGDAVEGELTSK